MDEPDLLVQKIKREEKKTDCINWLKVGVFEFIYKRIIIPMNCQVKLQYLPEDSKEIKLDVLH